jgi:hypothetical protein
MKWEKLMKWETKNDKQKNKKKIENVFKVYVHSKRQCTLCSFSKI